MKNSDYMNYLALNQNILGKFLIMGEGFRGKSEEKPDVSPAGIPVYLNGLHKMPDYSKVNTCYNIGAVIHPDAMMGMPGSSGKLHYELCITDSEFLVAVRLKLDEFSNGKSKPASELLALVKKEDLPDELSDHEDNYYHIAQEMMHRHFQELFKFYETFEELRDWEFQEDGLSELVKAYFGVKDRS
jgi:hypothetical protein